KVAGKADAGSRPQPLSAKGQPEGKATVWKVRTYLAPQKLEVSVDKAAISRWLPLPADVAVNVDAQERVDDGAKRPVLPIGINHERIAEMEDRLLPKPELANGGAIGGFAAFAERRDAALVFLAKHAVID